MPKRVVVAGPACARLHNAAYTWARARQIVNIGAESQAKPTLIVVPLWTCRSKERVLLLPTKLEAAIKDNTGRPCTQGEEETEEAEEEAEEERCWVCLGYLS